MISRVLVLLAAYAVLVGTAPLHAQGLSLRAGAGATLPVGGAGERYDAGPAVMLSAEARLSRIWSLRLDGEWARLAGAPTMAGYAYLGDSFQDLRTYGASLNALARFSEDVLAPYLLAGIGAYQLQRVDAPDSPYGTTGALQVGVGIDGHIWERLNPFAEVRTQVHVTDYGSAEFSPTVYWPILIGVRVR